MTHVERAPDSSTVVVDANLIGEIQLFAEQSAAIRARLAEIARVVHYAPDDVVFEQGQPRRALMLVHSGRITVSTRDGDSRVDDDDGVPLLAYATGDVLGEGVLIEGSLQASTGVAAEPTVIVEFPREALVEFFAGEPDARILVLQAALRLLTRRLEQSGFADHPEALQYATGATRREQDSLGFVEVPRDVYWGVQTRRALDNFTISGRRLSDHPELIWALATVKQAAARANVECGVLVPEVGAAIIAACEEVRSGRLRTQFPLDVIQGGAGTSTNMNANEVIANRALLHLGKGKGDYAHVHPNDHVNQSQSTNDFYPTALKLAAATASAKLTQELERLVQALGEKAAEFADVFKLGRTQLQDAVPMTLGQEFGAFAQSLRQEIESLRQAERRLVRVNMGGTAIGTGLNAPGGYAAKCVAHLRELSGFEIELAEDLIEATQDTQAFVLYSGALKSVAVKLSKIASDLRLLSSGPRAGLNEINLPAMQPGSSIMPGKVNPVIPEAVNQVAFRVIGNDLTVTMAAEAGQLQLNVMEPVIGASILESVQILSNVVRAFRTRCIEGVAANRDRCRELLEGSIGIVTALVPLLGYQAASQLAKEALDSNRGIVDLVRERGLLDERQIAQLLAPEELAVRGNGTVAGKAPVENNGAIGSQRPADGDGTTRG